MQNFLPSCCRPRVGGLHSELLFICIAAKGEEILCVSVACLSHGCGKLSFFAVLMQVSFALLNKQCFQRLSWNLEMFFRFLLAKFSR